MSAGMQFPAEAVLRHAEAVNDAVDALGETALNLRATASSMTATDAGNARRLDAAAGPGLDLPL